MFWGIASRLQLLAIVYDVETHVRPNEKRRTNARACVPGTYTRYIPEPGTAGFH